ncbi:disintegrin and metalloproteinase domain-containing protein 12-like isoform X2 [Ptychodera flava]|uniref:disintegrin and metalloproteinase domain-containing protein 12-like isoform X2 n=1 Tax=Ptychodera flava TaxID=63121 RepID=UPI003969F9B5
MDNAFTPFFVFVLSLLISGDLLDVISAQSSFSKQIEKLHHYEIFEPHRLEGKQKRDIATSTSDGHVEQTTFVFEAFGKDFILDVQLNEFLLPSNYVERYYLEDGTLVTKRPDIRQTHCYYHGEVRGSNVSNVALSTCNGLSGLISSENDTFYVEPLQNSFSNQHLIYKAQDVKRPLKATCGDKDSLFNEAFAEDMANLSKLKRVRRDVHTETKFIELFIVNDNREYQYMESDLNRVLERTKEMANLIDSHYKPLNVRVALIGVEVWSDGDMIEVSSDPMVTMENFQKWRKEELLPKVYNDNAQLVTGRTFEGNTVGMASLGGMCSSERSGGVNEDHGTLAAHVASTMTHEIGHNIGLFHDAKEKNCTCHAPPREGCIMEPASGTIPPTIWSSCSHEDFSAALEKGLGACLFDYPSEIYGGPFCGNGFKEEGEECDCGDVDTCDNPCCNPFNCTLHANATCAEGACCEDCQLKSAGTVCRDTVNECDLPEYCRGYTPECPANVYRQNGELCANTPNAYCFYGACMTHDQQCNDVWGSDATSSPELCYQGNHVRGDDLSNCGKGRDGKYQRCAEEDILCGRLMCQNGQNYPVKGSLAVTRLGFVYIDDKMYDCKAARIDLGNDVPDPGLAQPGTKCGEEMMCLDYECQTFAEIGIKNCPYNCSYHGVCNSNNNCHCDKEWAPPYCTSPGFGGSVDSGPIRPPAEALTTEPSVLTDITDFPSTDYHTQVIITKPISEPTSSGTVLVILILCLVVVPCLFVVGICLLYHRNRIYAWWRSRHYKQTEADANGVHPKGQPDVVKTHQLTTATAKPQTHPHSKPKPPAKTQNRPIHRVPYTGSFDRRSLERKSSERNQGFTEININGDDHANGVSRPAVPPARPMAPPAAARSQPSKTDNARPAPPPKPTRGGQNASPSKPETPSRPNSLPLRPVAPGRRAPVVPRKPAVPRKPHPNATVC